MLANRVMMGVYRFAEVVPSGPLPDIAVAPGTISAGMVSLTYAVPSVDKESIKVAPGAIVVDLFVPE